MRSRVILAGAVLLVAGTGVAASAAPQVEVAVKPATLTLKVGAPTAANIKQPIHLSFKRTVIPKGDKIVSYFVTYGDGSKRVTGKHLPLQLTHTYTKSGNFSIKASATDAHHHTSTTVDRIHIRGHLPRHAGAGRDRPTGAARPRLHLSCRRSTPVLAA